jgi:predicted nucleic acid-binding protein
MILTKPSFWKAFFDPTYPGHTKAKKDLLAIDRDKIAITANCISEVLSYLNSKKKQHVANWFSEYVLQTQSVKIIYADKKELEEILLLSIEKNLIYFEAESQYFANKLSMDLTSDY